MKALYIIAGIVLLALVGGGGFYGGIAYAQSQSQNATTSFLARRAANGQFGQGGTGANRTGQANSQFGQPVARGQVKSVNGNTVEISTATSVVTVQVNGQTTITKTDPGSISDLQPGDRVTVFSHDTSSSPTASAIQIQALAGATQ